MLQQCYGLQRGDVTQQENWRCESSLADTTAVCIIRTLECVLEMQNASELHSPLPLAHPGVATSLLSPQTAFLDPDVSPLN